MRDVADSVLDSLFILRSFGYSATLASCFFALYYMLCMFPENPYNTPFVTTCLCILDLYSQVHVWLCAMVRNGLCNRSRIVLL